MVSSRIANAHLWKHANGTYYAVWREGNQPKRKSLRTKQKVRAERELAKLKASGRRANDPHDLTVWDAVDRWLEEKHRPLHSLNETTLRQYRALGQRVKQFWSREELLDDLDTQQVYDWLDRLQRDGLTPQGVRIRLALLRQMLGWHNDLGNMSRNPARPIKLRGAQAQRTQAMLEPEFNELVADAEEWVNEAKLAEDGFYRAALVDLLVILFYSGLRSIEAFRVEWVDIDLEKRVWTIRSPQNKGGVKVLPIHSRAFEVLESRAANSGQGPFEDAEAIRNRWKRFKLARTRWKGTSFHALRHGFVTRLVLQGRRWEAQQLAGHHSEKMTDHYTHAQAEDLRDALEGI